MVKCLDRLDILDLAPEVKDNVTIFRSTTINTCTRAFLSPPHLGFRRSAGDVVYPIRLCVGYAQRGRSLSLLPSVLRSDAAQVMLQMQIRQVLQRGVPEGNVKKLRRTYAEFDTSKSLPRASFHN